MPSDLEKIRDLARPRIIGSEILVFDEVDSTNNLAKSRLAQNEGLMIVADSQTKGRGRLGRSWHSEKGSGIYLSFLLKPKIDPARFPRLTLMTAVAVANAINAVCHCRATLKWPNDILLNGKKICGILAEYCEEQNAVVIGVGINVNQSQFPESLEIAASLRMETGKTVDRVELLHSVINHLDREYGDFLAGGEQNLAQRWTGLSDMFGKKITLAHGAKTIEGVALGLSDMGNLLVRAEDGRELSFDSGEVTVLKT
jgi:BirA family biotin operon repressor/biotin-[acetyl-CoA-carboxylase] ligase